jgi:hypothetical protein
VGEDEQLYGFQVGYVVRGVVVSRNHGNKQSQEGLSLHGVFVVNLVM